MPLTDQERADLEALNSGQLSDAMEALNLRRSVVTGFMMLAPPGSKIVGTAVTLRQMPKNASEDRETRLTRHQDLSRKIAQKGEVVVIDNGGRLDTATWGEFHCYACKQNGVAGAVIDGATRDGPEIMNGPRHLFGEIIDRLLFFRPKIHPKREPYYHKPHYR